MIRLTDTWTAKRLGNLGFEVLLYRQLSSEWHDLKANTGDSMSDEISA